MPIDHGSLDTSGRVDRFLMADSSFSGMPHLGRSDNLGTRRRGLVRRGVV